MSVQGINPNQVCCSVSEAVYETDNGVLCSAIARIYQTVLGGNFFQYLQEKAVWAWNTTVEALKSEWMVISLIAFAAFAAFGATVAVQATLVFACARFAIVTWQDQGAQKSVERLNGENLALRLRNDELVGSVEIERLRAERAVIERNMHAEELQRVVQIRDDFILQRAPLLAERDRLQADIQRLQRAEGAWAEARQQMEAQIAQLSNERNVAVEQRANQAGDLERAVQNAERVEEQLGRVATFENFNRLLAQLLALYQNQQQGALPDVDQQLIDRYRQTRVEWNQKLAQHIDTLDQNDKGRIQLERILASSRGETEHLQGLFAVFQLQLAYRLQQAGHPVVVRV